MNLRPIPGQPGLFRFGALGVPVETLQAKLTAVQSQYDSIKSRMGPLLAAYGPLDTDALKRILLAVRRLGNLSVPVAVTSGQFVGVLRMGLASAARNLAGARAILGGGHAVGHEGQIAQLLTTAQQVLDALDALVSGAELAEGVVAAGVRRLGLSGLRGGLGAFVLDDTALAALAVVGLIVGAVLIYAVFAQTNAANTAWDAANEACQRDGAAGRPCTGSQWEAYRVAAERQASSDGLIPDLHGLFDSLSSVVLWGGLAAVAALIGYGIWTTYPAASTARSALQHRASSLRGLRGLCDQKDARAEALRQHLWSDAEPNATWERERARLKALYEEAEDDCWRELDREVQGKRRRGR